MSVEKKIRKNEKLLMKNLYILSTYKLKKIN